MFSSLCSSLNLFLAMLGLGMMINGMFGLKMMVISQRILLLPDQWKFMKAVIVSKDTTVLRCVRFSFWFGVCSLFYGMQVLIHSMRITDARFHTDRT